MTLDCDAAIVGAGPYGLSAAAYLLRIKGLGLAAFGEPMAFWRNSMPPGLFLRSAWSASHLADPDAALTLDAFRDFSGNHLSAPIALQRFIDYGRWFQESAVPHLQNRTVTSIDARRSGFSLTFDRGAPLTARSVIVAAGLSAFAHRPAPFAGIPSNLASHSSERLQPELFAGQRVAVIGSGQSALESAALLHEAGARVEIIMRRPAIHWLGWRERLESLGALGRIAHSPADVGPAGISRLVALPDLFGKLPQFLRHRLHLLCMRPAGARWLRDRLSGVPISPDRAVASVFVRSSGVSAPQDAPLHLLLSDASVRRVDHVVLGTGYRVDVARYSFLSPSVKARLHARNGFPLLSNTFESSVPGLHFIGAPSAATFGPLMYFVSGARYSAAALFHAFSGGRNVAQKAA